MKAACGIRRLIAVRRLIASCVRRRPVHMIAAMSGQRWGKCSDCRNPPSSTVAENTEYRGMFDELIAAYGSRFFIAAGGVGVALLVLIGVLWLLRGRAPSPFVRGGRNRQPRLQVLDAAAVDARRRLVLVRRDGVEHLIMIGGPTDIVIESGISAAKIALAPNASFETLVANEAVPSPARLEPPREEPRAIERQSPAEEVVVPAAAEPAAEIARPKPVIVRVPAPIKPQEPKEVPETAAVEPPRRTEPVVDTKPPHQQTPSIEVPAPDLVAEVPDAPPELVAEAPSVIELPSLPNAVVEPPAPERPPAPAAPAEKPHVSSPPAFEPRHRPEQAAAFEPVRRPPLPLPPAETPPPPLQVSITPERRPEPTMSRHSDEAEAVDILDAARHRVFAPDHYDSLGLNQPSPAERMPVGHDGVPPSPHDATAALISEIAPAVAINPAPDPAHAAKARQLGSDFESILEAEMSNNLSAQRIVPNAPVPPAPNAAESVPGQRRDPEMAPLTNSDSTLQQEVARIFGEMSVNRDK
jgi:hypothetical protein